LTASKEVKMKKKNEKRCKVKRKNKQGGEKEKRKEGKKEGSTVRIKKGSDKKGHKHQVNITKYKIISKNKKKEKENNNHKE
jgi:hypothetical protein